MFENQKDIATKAVYVALGAPVVATRLVRDYGSKLADGAQAQVATLAVEGEKTAKKIQGGNVVEELQHRVDMDKVQDRVEKLRDQLEGALQSWRESFTPAGNGKAPATKVKVESADEAPTAAARKPAASTKTATTKTTTKASTPKTTTAKKSTTKTTARKPAAKTTAAKKAPAKTTTTTTRTTANTGS